MSKLSKENIDLLVKAAVFTLTALNAAFLAGILVQMFGIEPWTVIYGAVYLLLICPLYIALMLIFAFVFRKYDWFYSLQKVTILRIVSFTKELIDKK